MSKAASKIIFDTEIWNALFIYYSRSSADDYEYCSKYQFYESCVTDWAEDWIIQNKGGTLKQEENARKWEIVWH